MYMFLFFEGPRVLKTPWLKHMAVWNHTRTPLHKESQHEQAHISAQQNQAPAHPRLPGPVADPGRTCDPAPSSRQGPQKPGRLGHPREHRLLRRPEFVACYDHGRRLISRSFIVFILPRPCADLPSRCGAGVGRKTGNAVRRNRVKRLIREFFRCNSAVLGPGWDLAVVPKRGIDIQALTLEKVTQELLPVLRKAAGSSVGQQRATGPQADPALPGAQ